MPPAIEEEEKNDKSDEHELFKFHLQLICKIAAHDQFYEEDWHLSDLSGQDILKRCLKQQHDDDATNAKALHTLTLLVGVTTQDSRVKLPPGCHCLKTTMCKRDSDSHKKSMMLTYDYDSFWHVSTLNDDFFFAKRDGLPIGRRRPHIIICGNNSDDDVVV